MSKLTTTAWLDWFEVFLLVCGLLVAVGVWGEQTKSKWKKWLRVFEILVVMGVAGELVADGGIFVFSRRLQTISDVEVAKAQERAAEAIERASNAELSLAQAKADAAIAKKEAAEASGVAEKERLERVKLEGQLAPRTLSELDRKDVADKLRQFAPSFSGRKATIRSYSADAEGIVFSLEIADILSRAGIEIDSSIGAGIPVGLVTMGVKVTGPSSDEAFIRLLLTSIHAHLFTEMTGEWGPKYTELDILVGVKPINGLPNIVPPP